MPHDRADVQIQREGDGITVRLLDGLYLLLIATLPIVRPFGVSVAGLVVPVSDLIFVVAALAWIADLVSRRRAVRPSRVYPLLALYFAALCCSAWFSESPGRSALKLVGETYLIGLAVLTINVVRSWTMLRRVLQAWMVATAVTVLSGVLAVLLFYAGQERLSTVFGLTFLGSLPPGNYPRVQSLFLNVNMLCNYLIVSLMLALVMRALGWLTRSRSRWLLAGTWITGLFTASAGIGGLLLGAGSWRWLRGSSSRPGIPDRLVFGGSLAAAAAFLAATTVVPFPGVRDTGFAVPAANVTLQAGPRVPVWQTAYRTFAEHPLVGQGLGTDVAVVEWVAPAGYTLQLRDAHNVWLSLAGQGGLLATTAFALLVAWLCRSVWPLRRGPDRSALVGTGLGLALIGALLYHGLSGAFEDARHLWVLMGLIACVAEGLDGAGAEEPTPTPAPATGFRPPGR